ncbi:Nucleoid occlusion protein [Aquimixticola soesokkakensis]|uniref:Nucleoid occlusion protein n=1 Tax=Aquimixticola soesokkakensis TaxID=1519096 RepID=A0A1Y5TG04_9RHOB|nr:ParB/RepB/Spo0J family partition protein [Aquimixticola soesokkakensis]SLN62997.1 Nucleoid occlusion protein [Aquimixticola soesokkakensis]
MAKRRKLEAPSADDISRFEEEFRRETAPRGPMSAPIAQVAAETAGAYDPRPAEARAEAARDKSDAARMRAVEEKGLVIAEIALEEIDADALVRDRVVLDADEMNELQMSIAANGLRLPIEVFALTDDPKGFKYGLLSGYRRLRATQALNTLKGGRYATIKALVRDPQAMGGTFAAMIEENEIRAALSHFERGRIAVIASQQGAFVNTEAAVNGLFPMASKAKRSKIRSFALIFEELGDMLTFPDLIKEREGLKLAAALREGHEARLREALASGVPETPAQEAGMIEAALATLAPAAVDPKRGGRPRAAARVAQEVSLQSGVTLSSVEEAQGWTIRLKGKRVDRELVDLVMAEISRLLERPD